MQARSLHASTPNTLSVSGFGRDSFKDGTERAGVNILGFISVNQLRDVPLVCTQPETIRGSSRRFGSPLRLPMIKLPLSVSKRTSEFTHFLTFFSTLFPEKEKKSRFRVFFNLKGGSTASRKMAEDGERLSPGRVSAGR